MSEIDALENFSSGNRTVESKASDIGVTRTSPLRKPIPSQSKVTCKSIGAWTFLLGSSGSTIAGS